MSGVNGASGKDALLNFGRSLVRVDLSDCKDEQGHSLEQIEVYVRGLSAGDFVVIAQARKETGGELGNNELCLLGACDAAGERYFTPQQAKDLDWRPAVKIAREILRVSGMLVESAEEAAKNSESSPS